MNCIVTGAAGFLGSHLVKYLVARDHYVLGIDDLSGGRMDNLTEVLEKKGFDFWRTDLAERGNRLDIKSTSLDDGIRTHGKFDVAFHLAADATEGRSQFHPVACTYDNYMASLGFFSACIRNNVKRIVFASSMSVYGGQPPPFDETQHRRPEDIYAISKASSESALEILSKVHDFEYVIVRPHNVYGPNQRMDDPYRNVVAIWMNAIVRRKACYMYGDGEQRRAFSYIDDITPCLANCALAATGEIVNLGAEKDYALRDLWNALVAVSEFDDARMEFLPPRPLEVKYAWATVEKSKRLLGFVDDTPLTEGLSRMWRWFRQAFPFGLPPSYVEALELPNEKTPKTWTDKLY